MGNYAKVENGVVTRVIVADQEYINTLEDKDLWVQTSYNTYGGVHLLGGTPFRKNYAGIGFSYDLERDAFIPPKPFPSWILNEDTCLWESLVPYPEDGVDGKVYIWNEDNLSWEHFVL